MQASMQPCKINFDSYCKWHSLVDCRWCVCHRMHLRMFRLWLVLLRKQELRWQAEAWKSYIEVVPDKVDTESGAVYQQMDKKDCDLMSSEDDESLDSAIIWER